MASLQPEDRTRLIRLLGMLGSMYDGERANAAALADRFVREKGMTWAEVVTPPPSMPPSPPRPRSWRDVLREVVEWQDALSSWERGFIETLRHWNGQPTAKQTAVLHGIAERFGIDWI